MPRKKQTCVIIGAGPAGLTAAYELLTRTNIQPIIFEKSPYVGGIASTVSYKGNKMDLGGHRFFTKSERVLKWWFSFLPLQKTTSDEIDIAYHKKFSKITGNAKGPDPEHTKNVMLLRKRKSRIYLHGKFYNYPISLSFETFSKLGFFSTSKIFFSYIFRRFFPSKKETNLEDFFINRYGDELYQTFFKSYTEKLWGVSCTGISADWGRQRIKGLSLGATITTAFKNTLGIKSHDVESSLIERFLYPKYGPGHLWEEVAKEIKKLGGEIHLGEFVTDVNHSRKKISSITIEKKGKRKKYPCDYLISTAAIDDLSRMMVPQIKSFSKLAEGLQFRNFIVAGVLVPKKYIYPHVKKSLTDTWIYIHDSTVDMLRMQIFNNWSPYLVKDKNNYWFGIEYFCGKDDDMWHMSQKQILEKAVDELKEIGFLKKTVTARGKVVKVSKAYPSYIGGSYKNLDKIRAEADAFKNMFLIGRNGMHRYNNQDHSMLAAMYCVDALVSKNHDKSAIWNVNADDEYHEK